jgi:hypothetical protein
MENLKEVSWRRNRGRVLIFYYSRRVTGPAILPGRGRVGAAVSEALYKAVPAGPGQISLIIKAVISHRLQQRLNAAGENLGVTNLGVTSCVLRLRNKNKKCSDATVLSGTCNNGKP